MPVRWIAWSLLSLPLLVPGTASARHPRPPAPVAVAPQPVPVVIPPTAPPLVVSKHSHRVRKDLERQVERAIRQQFCRDVKDVDVNVDLRCGQVQVEVEVCHPALVAPVQAFVATLPQLASFQVRLAVEVDG